MTNETQPQARILVIDDELGIREGAYDFLAKPFSADALLMTTNRALEHRQLLKERERLRAVEDEIHEATRARAEL